MATPSAADDAQLSLVRELMTNIPFNRELGLSVVDLGAGRAVLRVPFRDGLVGDPVRPALHGGVISSLADACGGAAVWTLLGPEDRCSTVDLRIDYLRPGSLEPLEADARVQRLGGRVGVAAIRLYHPDRQDETVAEGKGVYAVKRAEDR